MGQCFQCLWIEAAVFQAFIIVFHVSVGMPDILDRGYLMSVWIEASEQPLYDLPI